MQYPNIFYSVSYFIGTTVQFRVFLFYIFTEYLMHLNIFIVVKNINQSMKNVCENNLMDKSKFN